jgi:hypothetical protein
MCCLRGIMHQRQRVQKRWTNYNSGWRSWWMVGNHLHMRDEWWGRAETCCSSGMAQAWVGQKLVNVTFYEFFLGCPIFALGPRFHKNRDILEVIHYNDKLLF